MLKFIHKKQSPLSLVSPLETAIKRGEKVKTSFLSKQGGDLSNIEACRVLTCSPPELETMRRNHQVLGLSVNEELVYPAWQFIEGKVLS